MAKIRNLAIDLGTSNVLIYQEKRHIALRQPAVVAVERNTRKVLAIGTEAHRMIGRTPGNILAMRPLKEGVVADFELTNTMLRHFVQALIGKRFFRRPHVVMSVPSGVGEAEKSSIVSILFDAGISRTHLLPRPIAAAIGVGLDYTQPYGCMVVDMGAGLTDIAVLASGQIIESRSVAYAGDQFDDAIIRYLLKKHNLLIGPRTAEELKISIGTAIPPVGDVLTKDVTGRDNLSKLPRTMTITSAEVYEAIKHVVEDLAEAIDDVIRHAPPQLATDIYEEGIVLTGGAAALPGLPEAIFNALNIPCGVAEDPQTCVVMGCAKVLDNPKAYDSLLKDKRRSVMK